jgi:hypothetical protein
VTVHRVFAYGSNMHVPDVRRWLRANGHPDPGPLRVERALLPDHALAWNYRSVSRGGGAANVVPIPGAEVRGVVVDADAPLLAAFDAKEGHPRRYDRGDRPVAVQLWGGGGAADAWLYRVTPAFTSSTVIPPRAAYLHLLVEAAEAHDLGADYVAALRRIPTAG